MPRKESLSQIIPNKFYSIDATIKYKHETENYTTAVIEQDST